MKYFYRYETQYIGILGSRHINMFYESEFDDTEWCRMDASSAAAVVSALRERDTEIVIFFHESGA